MSQNEEEYFKKQDEEKKRKKIFEQYVYMHCPKCGAALQTMAFEGLQIDRCTGCQGIWLDKGELDVLRNKEPQKKSGFLGMLFGDVAQ